MCDVMVVRGIMHKKIELFLHYRYFVRIQHTAECSRGIQVFGGYRIVTTPKGEW